MAIFKLVNLNIFIDAITVQIHTISLRIQFLFEKIYPNINAIAINILIISIIRIFIGYFIVIPFCKNLIFNKNNV